MKRTARCPKCGSAEVMAEAKAIDNEGVLSVATFRKPQALLFKGQLTTTLSAWVCTECGYVELYADAPQQLRVRKT